MLDKIQELSINEKKTIQELGLKLSEETGELTQAILSATKAPGCEYKGYKIGDVQIECVDTILVALSIFFKTGGDEKDLLEFLKFKTNKWERVTETRN